MLHYTALTMSRFSGSRAAADQDGLRVPKTLPRRSLRVSVHQCPRRPRSAVRWRLALSLRAEQKDTEQGGESGPSRDAGVA